MRILGIAHRDQLRAEEVSRRDLDRWSRRRDVTSVQPWYLTSEAPADLVALLRLGVRPTCLDAAALHGLWTPHHPGTHVYRPCARGRREELGTRTVQPLRRRKGKPYLIGPPQKLVFHGHSPRAWPDVDPVPDLGLVLDHAGRCLPTVKAAVLLESALNKQVMTIRQVEQIIAGLPYRTRRALARVRADAESGTETTVRWWFEARGITIRSQVRFPQDSRRMDLLVGQRLAIECDSREHHDDALSYDEDRERDLYLAAQGFTVVRLSWQQVFLHWPRTEKLLLAILSRGEHLRPPRPGQGALAA